MLIVAVNYLGLAKHSDVMEALFGKEQLQIYFSNSEPSQIIHTKQTRAKDGAWIGEMGVKYTRISALLFSRQITPWNLVNVNLRLYHNPWAKRSGRKLLGELPQAIPENGEMKLSPDVDLGKLLKLPKSWPQD
ncbi:MAG: hypothetical protein MI924_15485 [Chloroflexales bacterium]|nr:hypothetical protein [Chloroflexales bacterium]